MVTVGLEPGLAALRLLGQVHNSRSASFLRHCSFVHHASASLYPALRALGSAPHRCIRQTSPDQINYRHAKTPPIRVVLCGLYWTRTSDPIDVNDVLYQLSQQTIGTGSIIQSSSIFVKDSFPKLEPGPFPDSNRVRNLNRREMTLQRSPHLFRLTRSPHFRQGRTAHRADVRFSPPIDLIDMLCQLSQQTKRTGMRIHSRSIIVRDSFSQTDTGLPSLYGGNPSAS